MQKIAYCTNIRLPSERAHSHQVARVCDALVGLGHSVTIFAPFRENPVMQDYWEFHQANRKVHLEQLGTFDPIDHPLIPKVLQLPILNYFFTKALQKKLLTEPFDLLYTRTPALLPVFLNTGKKVVLELHTLPTRNRNVFVEHCGRCALVVCLTTPMRDELKQWGVEEKRLTVEADGIDLKMFESRRAFVQEKYTAGYAGQRETMGLSKGIPDLLKAFEILHERRPEARLAIAGPRSKNEQLESALRKAVAEGYVVDLGFLHWNLIPGFLRSCDILVYPAPTSDHPFYNRDTSPLKIFEYMAAGKPIVTADLPPIRDVLGESTAFFCKPGDPNNLAETIAHVMDHREEAEKRAKAAHATVQHYTWDKRMQRILDAIP